MAKRPVGKRAQAVVPTVALAWFDAAQWAKLKQVAEDADHLSDSHAAWQRGAEDFEREIAPQRHQPATCCHRC